MASTFIGEYTNACANTYILVHIYKHAHAHRNEWISDTSPVCVVLNDNSVSEEDFQEFL